MLHCYETMSALFIFLLFFSFLLESTVTSLPLVLDMIIVLYIFQRKSWVFWAAFISGLLLDTVSLNPLGRTSIFFLIFLFIASLYEKKFEISSSYFVLIYSFLGSLIFLWMFGGNSIILQSVISSLATLLIFTLFKSSVFNFKRDNRQN